MIFGVDCWHPRKQLMDSRSLENVFCQLFSYWTCDSLTVPKFVCILFSMSIIVYASLQMEMISSSSSSESTFLRNFRVPAHILLPDSKVDTTTAESPICPVLVFINPKSGGQLGADLLITCRTLLNEGQVDLHYKVLCISMIEFLIDALTDFKFSGIWSDSTGTRWGIANNLHEFGETEDRGR